MKKETNVEVLERVKKLNGKVRGSCSLAIFEHLRTRGISEEKIKEIKEKINSYGYQVDPEKNSLIGMYPIDFELAILFSIQEVLDWRGEKIRDLGRSMPKLSFMLKVFLKHIGSVEKFYSYGPAYWDENSSLGRLEMGELNKEKGYMVLYLKDFNVHSIYCDFLMGYLQTIAGFILGDKKEIVCLEEECLFSGSPHHKFIVKWK